MEIQIAKESLHTDFGLEENTETPTTIECVECETINIYEKFHNFLAELESKGYRIEKIVLHTDIYRALKQSDRYLARYAVDQEREYDMFMGVKIEPKRLGPESITDFIIYTDRKVVHSEMLEKTFLEDVDDKQLVENLNPEELIHETNTRIEGREDED